MIKYKLVIDIDPTDGVVSAWSSDSTGGLLTTMADTMDEALANIRMLIADFQEHEWRDVPEWQGVNADDVQFEFEYAQSLLSARVVPKMMRSMAA